MSEPMQGYDEMVANLKKIGEKRTRALAVSALKKGAQPIRNYARTHAPDDPSTPNSIAKNIVIRTSKKRYESQMGGPAVRVGVLGGAADRSSQGEIKGGGKENPGGETFYWRFLEFGTKRGIAERSFMRDSMNTPSNQAFADFAADFENRINRELAKK